MAEIRIGASRIRLRIGGFRGEQPPACLSRPYIETASGARRTMKVLNIGNAQIQFDTPGW